jgi:hypothetical protein
MSAVSPLLWYSEDPKVGFALNNTFTAWTSVAQSTIVETPGPISKLGDVCQGNNNSKWVYVQASSTVTAGNVVYISPQFTANNIGTSANATALVVPASLAKSNLNIGIAQFTNGNPTNIQATGTQVVANTNDYFWACLEAEAGLQINTSGSITAGTVVYVANATNGSVTVAGSTSAVTLLNLYCNTASTTSTAGASQTTTDFFTVGRIRTSTSA